MGPEARRSQDPVCLLWGNQPPQSGLRPESLCGRVTLDLFKHLLETPWLVFRRNLLLGTERGDDFICRVTALSKLPTSQGAILLGCQGARPFQVCHPGAHTPVSAPARGCSPSPSSSPPSHAHTLSTSDEGHFCELKWPRLYRPALP